MLACVWLCVLENNAKFILALKIIDKTMLVDLTILVKRNSKKKNRGGIVYVWKSIRKSVMIVINIYFMMSCGKQINAVYCNDYFQTEFERINPGWCGSRSYGDG